MTGLLILIIAISTFVVALIDGSEFWASVSLFVAGLTLIALIWAGYARLGAWLWGV